MMRRSLPPVALPADPATAPPFGRRLRDGMAAGEILRDGRLQNSVSSETGALVGDGRGAVALISSTPHLEPGDRVDLYALLSGEIVAEHAEVIAVTDGMAVVAVDDDALADVILAFTTGDVVPVLVG